MRSAAASVGAIALVAASIGITPVANAAATADLAVSQNAAPGTRSVKLTVGINNRGPSGAGPTTLTEQLAASGITSVREISNSAAMTCSVANPPTGYALALLCTIPRLPAGRNWTVTFTVAAPTGTALTSNAQARGRAADPVPANNQSVINARTGPVADIGLKFVSVSTPFPFIGPESAIVDVVNHGPNRSGKVKIAADPLGHQASFGTASNCPSVTTFNKATCVLPSLASGEGWRLAVSYNTQGSGDGDGIPVMSLGSAASFDPNRDNDAILLPVR